MKTSVVESVAKRKVASDENPTNKLKVSETIGKAARERGAKGAGGLRRRQGVVEGEEQLDIGRQFVQGLARGLELLNVFRRGDPPLGNQELAERTGMPKPTVSRIGYTLAQLGYLSYDARTSTYELGGAAMALGFVAQSNPNVRNVARPFLTKLASLGTATIGLGVRSRIKMLYVDAYEGKGMVGLRVSSGTHIPLATTAMGRAYLYALGDDARGEIIDELQATSGDDWPLLRKSIDSSLRQIADKGYCMVEREWESDVTGVASPIIRPNGMTPWVINAGGHHALLSQEILNEVYAPELVAAARQISMLLGGVTDQHGLQL